MWIQISQLLQKLADLDLHVCQVACAMSHDLFDTRVTCIHLLKISNDGNFFLLFGDILLNVLAFSIQASAKF